MWNLERWYRWSYLQGKNRRRDRHNRLVDTVGEGAFSSVQSLSRVWLFVTPWTVACWASMFITNSQSSLKLMPIESVMPSNHLILCRPLLPPSIFPSIRVFSNESALRIGVSASVLPMNIQDWYPLGWTGWISLKCKRFWRVFSNTTVQKHQFFDTQLTL